MRRVSILFFIFFTISLFGQMPTNLTSIHKLGDSFTNFEKNNPQYKKEKDSDNNDFLIRNKPDYTGYSWNYDLIVISKSYKNDKITSMLFKCYSMSSKEHIKNIETLKSYLSNQFRANKYSVKDEERQKDLINYTSNDPTMKYVDKDFDTENIEVLLLLEDMDISSLFLFFKYKNQYYIYISKNNTDDNTKTTINKSTTTTIPRTTTSTTTTTIPKTTKTSTTTTTIPTTTNTSKKNTYDDIDINSLLNSDIMRDEFDLLEKMQIIMNSYEKKDDELKKYLNENKDKFLSMKDFFIDLKGRIKNQELKNAIDYQIKIFDNQDKINDLATNTNDYNKILKLIDESNSLFKDFIDAIKKYHEQTGM